MLAGESGRAAKVPMSPVLKVRPENHAKLLEAQSLITKSNCHVGVAVSLYISECCLWFDGCISENSGRGI